MTASNVVSITKIAAPVKDNFLTFESYGSGQSLSFAQEPTPIVVGYCSNHFFIALIPVKLISGG